MTSWHVKIFTGEHRIEAFAKPDEINSANRLTSFVFIASFRSPFQRQLRVTTIALCEVVNFSNGYLWYGEEKVNRLPLFLKHFFFNWQILRVSFLVIIFVFCQKKKKLHFMVSNMCICVYAIDIFQQKTFKHKGAT